MKYFYITFFVLCNISCKRNNEPQPSMAERLNHLAAKKIEYCEYSRAKYKEKKYVHSQCDGLLFTSLRAIGCKDVDMSVFEDNGRWYRDPDHACGPSSDSDSTISKDMMVGLFNYLAWSGDLNATNRTVEYGKAHDWIMGECKDEVTKLSKCLLSPGLVGNLLDLQKVLKNALGINTNRQTEAIGVNTGFLAHLDVLHALFSSLLYGAITDQEKMMLKSQADRQPRNALYQAAYHMFEDGNQQVAVDLLLDESRFPDKGLPGPKNYCTEYLYQRDEDPSDWSPCADTNGELYSGTDFIFAAAIIDGSYVNKRWK